MYVKKFYNFGYTMILTPLFKMFSDFVTIYRGMLFCNIVVHALFAGIAYYMVTKYFHCSKMTGIAIALISSYNAIVLFFRGFIYNEVPLALCVWVTLLLLLKLAEENGKMRYIWSALLGLVCAYAYLIHSRCVIIYGTLVVVFVLYLLIYKKFLVNLISFAIVFVGGVFAESKLIEYVKLNLYMKNSDVVMKNSVKAVLSSRGRYRTLTSLKGIRNLIAQFFSLAGAMTIETGGLLTIVTVIVLYYMVKNRKKWRRGEEDKYRWIAIMFSTISLWGMVVAIALTGASNGKVRFIAYVRYFMPFLGPFLMIGLVLLKQDTSLQYRWIVFWSGILTMIVGVVYVFYAYPILYGCKLREITSFYFFMAFVRYKGQLKFTKNILIIAFGLLILFTGILLYLYRKKQTVAFCMVAILFSVLLVWQVEMVQCNPASVKRYEMSDGINELMKIPGIKENTICCAGSGIFKKAVLVSEYDIEDIIYYNRDLEDSDDMIILTNQKDQLEEYQLDSILRIDQNEWIGVRNPETTKILKEYYQIVE